MLASRRPLSVWLQLAKGHGLRGSCWRQPKACVYICIYIYIYTYIYISLDIDIEIDIDLDIDRVQAL